MKTAEVYLGKVVGFANSSCRRCHGTGREAWQDHANGTVIPCRCVVFFDMDRVREEAEADSAQQQEQAAKN